MKYRGKDIEILGKKEIFGQQIVWIRILESNEFLQVNAEEVKEDEKHYSLSHIRFVALAAKIKDEIAKKSILAPYESSLIPLPHQILVLEKVMQSDQNRFLLADEVGMGKTIEAGLILKELKLRGDVKRILVIVPKSAMMQWQSELKEHFNEIFHIYDSELINSLSRTFSNINVDQEFNFWEQHHQIIVSTDALKPISYRQGWPREKVDDYNRYRMEAVLRANFDLVIIDEVHKMGGANPTVSRYLLAQALCDTVPNAILLSATPHRGKADHFRRILQLLDPDAFDGEGLPEINEIEPYVIRTEKRLAVDYEGNKLFNERETIRFDVYLDQNRHQLQRELYEDVTNYVRSGFNSAKKSKNSAKGLIMILFQRLVSSSTAAILSAMEGRLLRLQSDEEDVVENYSLDMDKIMEEEESGFDLDGIYNSLAIKFLNDEEAYLKDLIAKAKNCIKSERDAKADAFIEKYRRLQQEYNNPDLKVLVFTEFRTTQMMLKKILETEGLRVTIINGSQEIDERKTNLSKFKNDCQILIATDAAGESLNMQFSHIVFNYDLPWNPMMIEQRIGRVDRIGQKTKVKAFNMMTDNSVDRRVYEVIQIKLSNIMMQLGIDKTSDVLDSTLEQDKINNLYLQSLLDPSKFEFAGEKWLNEIKSKLKDYQATESILPEVKEEEIDPKKASEVRYSPLPYYLENLLLEYTRINHGSLEYMAEKYVQVGFGKTNYKLSFDSETSLSNPGIEHLTLQHDLVKKILTGIGEFEATNEIPVLTVNSDEDTSGYWSLWQISAQNSLESKETYQAYFVSNEGKVFHAYANNLWDRFISSPTDFIWDDSSKETFDYLDKVLPFQESAFRQLESQIQESIRSKYEKKKKSYEFQQSRIAQIGIENIKRSKLNKLRESFESWETEFHQSSRVIPTVRHLLSVKIDAK
jgi:superfamily II DNA or RNA helicase